MRFLRRLNKPVYMLIAVAAIAGGLRFWDLGYPAERVFDEVYYSKDACLYAGYSLKTCGIDSTAEKYWVKERDEVGSWVHPPLGKWMIAIGEKISGVTSFGWRFSAALFGTLTCVLVAAMALLLFRSVMWGFVAGLLLATESLSFVMSRVALLDVFVGFWVTLGFYFLLLDRRWIQRRSNRAEPEPPPGPDAPMVATLSSAADGSNPPLGPEVPMVTTLPREIPSPLWRPWRFAMGIAFGAAVATKWSGLYALAGAMLLTLFWERTRRKEAGQSHAFWKAVMHEALGVTAALVLVPIGVYLLSYARYWALHGIHPTDFWALHRAMEEFHTTLSRLKPGGKLTHPYESQPWTFFIMARPVNFFFEGQGAEILAIGNPAIFWGSIATVPYCAYSWRKRRDPRAGLITVAILAQWLPWFFFANRVQFFFYMVPLVPFMVLSCVYALRRLSDATEGRGGYSVSAIALVSLSVGLFVYFWPILTGFPLNSFWWHKRIWFPGWF